MSRPAALLTDRRRALTLFVVAELTLALSIPFLAIAGYHTVLESRAGNFIEEPQPTDPGWRALVDPSPVTAVVEMDGGAITGLVLLAGHAEESGGVAGPSIDDPAGAIIPAVDGGGPPAGVGGTAILVPATLQIDSAPLSARAPSEAVAALAAALRLRIAGIEIVDEARWASILGETSYRLANPDPVVDEAGRPLLAVGEIDVGADQAAVFLGRPAPASDPITLLFRRQLFWDAVLASPPASSDGLAVDLIALAGTGARVELVPMLALEPNPSLDPAAAEALIRDVVPVPAGANPGDRAQVRVIDRTGRADLGEIAADVASAGFEVVEIGNALEFDGGATHLVVPVGVDGPELIELARLTGATTVLDDDVDAEPVVTLLVGADFGSER